MSDCYPHCPVSPEHAGDAGHWSAVVSESIPVLSESMSWNNDRRIGVDGSISTVTESSDDGDVGVLFVSMVVFRC